MPKKLISITLTFVIILISMVIPIYATSPSVTCSVSEGSKVTITWGGNPSRLQIFRDNVLFKDFQNNIQNGSKLSFIETAAGTHTYTAKAFSSDNSSATATCTVVGTGKSSIRLEFINKHGTSTSVERIYNWVRIYNDGSNDIDLSKLKIRYFYTVDGEPSAAKSDANNGQKKEESSDARTNPTQEYFQYPNGNKDKSFINSTRMKFTKMFPVYKNSAGITTADYYCDTYFENPGSEGKIPSASYSLTLQPAFKKIVNDYESNSGNGAGFIKYYDPRNDYSFDSTATDWKENENICVYYDDQLIWGNEPIVKLNTPTNLTAEFINFSNVTLNWTASTGAQSYKVYKSESISGTYSQIANGVTGTTYVDSTVQIENTPRTYYYKVVAVYNTVTSDNSNVASATVAKLPAPANLKAEYKDFSNVTLNWTASTGAQSYRVYRSESSSGTYSQIANGVTETTYVDSTVQIGDTARTYYYKVVAVYNAVTSDSSGVASATVAKLPAPSNLKAVYKDFSNVTLNWTASTGAQSYKVYRSESSSGTYSQITNGVTETTYVDSTVQIENTPRTYYYKVVAVLNAVTSDNSNVASATVAKLPAPANLKAEYKDFSNVTLNWTASTGAQSYKVYRSESISGTYSQIANVVTKTTYVDSTVQIENTPRTYYYKVVAVYNAVTSDNSGVATATVGKLPAPANLKAEYKDFSNVTLSWTASTGAQSYRVYRSESSSGTYSQIANGVTGTTYVDSTVQIENTPKTYYYKVVAVYNDIQSDYSDIVNATVSRLVAPKNLTADFRKFDAVVLKWTASEYAQSYNVYRSDSKDGKYDSVITGVKELTYIDNKVEIGDTARTYYYKVVAVYNDIQSEDSDIVNATVSRLVAPRNLNADFRKFDAVVLRWTASEYAQSYNVYRSDSKDGKYDPVITGVKELTYIDSTVEIGGTARTYYYKIVAVYNDIQSDDSDIVNVSVSRLVAPKNLNADFRKFDAVVLKWTASEYAQSYNVYRSDSKDGKYDSVITGVKELTYIDSTVQIENTPRTYYYKVVAVYNDIQSEDSDIVNATVSRLVAPRNLNADFRKFDAVVLKWTASEYAQSYNVYRSDSKDGKYDSVITGVKELTYIDSTVEIGDTARTYYYKVVAVYNDIQSEDSDIVNATVSRLVAPRNLNADFRKFDAVVLRWTASEYAQSYNVYRSDSKDGKYDSVITGVKELTYIDSTVEIGDTARTYYYKVVAVYNDIHSEASDIKDVTIKRLAAPTNLTANVSDITNVELIWSASEDAQSYIVYRSENSDGPYSQIQAGITGTTYTNIVPMPKDDSGITYYYKVVAVYHDIQSEDSDIKDVTISRLAAPTNLTAVVSNLRQVTLNWTASEGAQSYIVYRSESSDGTYSQIQAGITDTTTFDTVPTPTDNSGKKYYYKVAAVYKTIQSDKSDYKDVTIKLNAPINLTANVSDFKKVTLNWAASEGAQSYIVYRSGSSDGDYTQISTEAAITVTEYEDYTIPTPTESTGTKYYYKVVAVYDTIYSEKSEFIEVPIELKAPTELQAEVTEFKKVTLNWTASEGAQSYIVYRSVSSDGDYIPISTEAVTGTNYEDNTVPTPTENTGREYFYKVKAVYEKLHSEFSGYARARVSNLVAPTNLEAEVRNFKIVTLKWNASDGAQSYIVYRSESEDGTYNQIKDKIIGTTCEDTVSSPTEESKKYYYKVAAVYNTIISEKSDFVDATIYRYSTSLYWDSQCRIISDENQTDFALGTYIPVAVTIIFNKDTKNPGIILDNNLKNITFEYNPEVKLESKKNESDLYLCMAKLKSGESRSLNDKVSIVKETVNNVLKQEITIDGDYDAGKTIYVEFVLKVSPTMETLTYGITHYYGEDYHLGFTIVGKQAKTETAVLDDDVSTYVDSLTVKITKPDKLK